MSAQPWRATKRGNIENVRTFFVLICSLVLVCAVRGETKKTHAQSSKPTSSSGKSAASGGAHAPHPQAPQQKPANATRPAEGNPQVHTQGLQHVASPGLHPTQVSIEACSTNRAARPPTAARRSSSDRYCCSTCSSASYKGTTG
jgi:hypothetical protein